MRNIFPFELIEKNSKIVIYCATSQGYEFYRQVMTTNYCEIIAWVDRQYKWYQSLNLPVRNPEDIVKSTFDYVVLACETRKTMESIKNYLIGVGVDPEKIIWKEDYSVGYDVVAKYDEDKMKKDSESAVCINPIQLLEERRMDVVIRYLYAKDLIEKKDADYTEYLYKKFVTVQMKSEESTHKFMMRLFSAYESKTGIDTFIDSMKQLISSMEQNGFLKEQFIPLDRLGRLLNGSHRCAVAIALGMDVWTKEYDYEGFQCDFSAAWMRDNEFTEEETQYVVNAYNELIQKKED